MGELAASYDPSNGSSHAASNGSVVVSLQEAAHRLDISLNTARRWAREGKLSAELVQRRQGPVWQVRLPVEREASSQPHMHPPTEPPTVLEEAPLEAPTASIELTSMLAGLSEALQLVAQLQADYRAAEERHQQQLVELAGRCGFLQAELQQRDEQLKALQAPQPEPVPQEPAVTVEPAQEPQRAPWWRRWFAS